MGNFIFCAVVAFSSLSNIYDGAVMQKKKKKKVKGT